MCAKCSFHYLQLQLRILNTSTNQTPGQSHTVHRQGVYRKKKIVCDHIIEDYIIRQTQKVTELKLHKNLQFWHYLVFK